ncbi:hypothetical protein GUJ93_ZPchr0012g22168 [Zizania palustris]|uniref:Uncharacterized protein n=1 Tax=Zizania palustris TaxID=103762 RepID=A0A8J5WUH0_ZIZPA|nr:hypothetical protein GUJ93_ZPchr0012g22168 [Zizania palustris]
MGWRGRPELGGRRPEMEGAGDVGRRWRGRAGPVAGAAEPGAGRERDGRPWAGGGGSPRRRQAADSGDNAGGGRRRRRPVEGGWRHVGEGLLAAGLRLGGLGKVNVRLDSDLF